MGKNAVPPCNLYKYLNTAGMENFFRNPGVIFSSVATFSDGNEGMCASWLPGGQTESMTHKAYEDSLYGILCLSEDPASERMWEEYAESHCGVMIEFDPLHSFFNQEPFQGVWNKVDYDDEPPILPPSPLDILFGIGNDQEHRDAVKDKLRHGIRRKGTQYAFEKEWRKGAILLNPGSKRQFPFPAREIKNIIRSVTMGSNISETHKDLCHDFANRYGIPLKQA